MVTVSRHCRTVEDVFGLVVRGMMEDVRGMMEDTGSVDEQSGITLYVRSLDFHDILRIERVNQDQ